jgi:hypothetical protein
MPEETGLTRLHDQTPEQFGFTFAKLAPVSRLSPN